tara:strand:+ start:51 stop:1877 length:1827 start_codon:yes stop_codon:yes gene_type:complete
MRIVEAEPIPNNFMKALKQKYQTWHGRTMFNWIDKVESEMVRRGLIHDSEQSRANFRAEAFALVKQEIGLGNKNKNNRWEYEQEHDTFKNIGTKKQPKWVERPWNERGYGPIACRDTCVNAVNDFLNNHDPNNNRYSYDEFKVQDYVTPGPPKDVIDPDGKTRTVTSAKLSDPYEPFRIGLIYYWTKKTRLLNGDNPGQVDVALKRNGSDFNTYLKHHKAYHDYFNAGENATNEQKRRAIEAENYMRQVAFGSYNGGAGYRKSSRAKNYAKTAMQSFKEIQTPIYRATIRDMGIEDKHDKMAKKGYLWNPRKWDDYLFGDDEDKTGVADQVIQQLPLNVIDFVMQYGPKLRDKFIRYYNQSDNPTEIASKIEQEVNKERQRLTKSSKTEPNVIKPANPEVEPMTKRLLKPPDTLKSDSEATLLKPGDLKRQEVKPKNNESTIKEDFETHQHSTREVVTSFVKNILKLNASGSQIDKFMNKLDVTDIIAIHKAMASGNYDKLSLGEKLQEYITPAQKGKEKQPVQQTQPTGTLKPMEPNEPTRIAGNNPNPEMPPTGASQSTRKPVPSMKRSEVKRNAVITNPDTGEEFLVTNDLVASQMMQRAKRISA